MSIKTVKTVKYYSVCDSCNAETEVKPNWSKFKYDMIIKIDSKTVKYRLCNHCKSQAVERILLSL